VVVTTFVDGRTLWIDVRDAGPGVESVQRERIFERFERLDAGARGVAGNGLGLCVSRGLMEAMVGSLEVVDTTEPGATFRIGLPLAPDRLRFEAVPRTPNRHYPGPRAS
jgi:K+-sensing histidine kinase KdpD